ncbi:MAG: SRPBCC family protein [Cyclobacteriaceae bacterium]|nr:SRPBCC family protein [Cyclobacteriaceae bacterium]
MTIINKEITINKGIEEAWKVLGHEFAHADRWASSVKHSQARDSKTLNGSTCSERGCDIPGMGSIKEKLLKYSNEDHVLSYQVYEGMPSMVKFMSNTWKLFPTGPNSCKLTMQMEMETGGLMGALMKPMMKMQMSGMAGNIVEDFKYYVEKGQPHPRKIKSMRKK